MEQEVILEMEKEKKKEGDKKGKKKKKKKGDAEKENKEPTCRASSSPSSMYAVSSSDAEDYVEMVTTDGGQPSKLDFMSTPKMEQQLRPSDDLAGRHMTRGHSPVDEGKPLHSTSFEDDLSCISVKKLTESYLSATEQKQQQQQQQRKRSPSPNSTPVRPRTPISQLVETYTPPPYSATSSPVKHNPLTISGASTPNYPLDFTPGISLQSLKSAYESSANKSLSSADAFSVKEEVNVSFSQLREAYCNTAGAPPERGSTPPRALTPSRNRNEKNIPSIRNLEPTQVSTDCRICGKQVFQMEKIVAEKASWHKNCFRCKECNKNLTLETYQSHEGSLYCKPHFKELFRPKAVVQDEAEERKDRSTEKPDYGLEELQQTLNVKERFAVFENLNKESERPKTEPISVRRSQSLMSKAARFLDGHDDRPYVDGEYDDEEEEEDDDEEEDEEEEEEEGDEDDPNRIVKSKKRKERPMSFSGMGDLKAVWEQKQRREEMSQSRKEEISRFRQMLCAGKNSSLKEKFESGNFEDQNEDDNRMKEQIKIEVKRAASNLKKRFEQGQPFIIEDDEGDDDEEEEEEEEEGIPRRRRGRIGSEKQEVEEVFKEAETAKKARNVFKQIDSQVAQEGTPILRSQSFAASSSTRENRRSLDGMHGSDDLEVLGRDPNLIKCTDNYQDEVDCRNTKNILQMFRKMEMGNEEEEDDDGPRPLKRFTPPPDAGEYDEDSEEEYSDEEYTDEEEEDDVEDDDKRPHIRDELLQMATPSQSARKAASLRAKFERWEANQNELNSKEKEELEECMPSLDTAKNLRAMFEHKANEVVKPVASKPITQKVNRFV